MRKTRCLLLVFVLWMNWSARHVVVGCECDKTEEGKCQCESCAPAPKKPAPPNPCASSHKPLFYDNDFNYLYDPNYNGHCLGDDFKLMPVACGDWGTLDIGGQLRLRYHHEQGMGQSEGLPRFERTDTDFMLTRVRLFGNWDVNEYLRVYTEGIFAYVTDDGGLYTPRPIDQNFGDFLNLFADVRLTEELTARIGRQELLYGAQRLVSPLDWANTRRTFEGVKLIAKADDWTVEGFFTHYVPVIPNELDEPDYNQPFYGCHAKYAGIENILIDSYYFGYDNNNPGAITNAFSLHTLGLRITAEYEDWLFEFEGGPQFGRQSGLGVDDEAMFLTGGIGRKLGADLPWSPTLWIYYDYASGNAIGGDFNRFNQLFPLAHKYLGFIDAVQRSNIEAPNLLLTLQPSKKVELLFWYYHFMANQADDIVPSIGGTPPQSLERTDFGDEVDVTVKYQFGPRSNILFGWSHFWRGSKILAPEDADFLYTQWEVNF